MLRPTLAHESSVPFHCRGILAQVNSGVAYDALYRPLVAKNINVVLARWQHPIRRPGRGK